MKRKGQLKILVVEDIYLNMILTDIISSGRRNKLCMSVSSTCFQIHAQDLVQEGGGASKIRHQCSHSTQPKAN